MMKSARTTPLLLAIVVACALSGCDMPFSTGTPGASGSASTASAGAAASTPTETSAATPADASTTTAAGSGEQDKSAATQGTRPFAFQSDVASASAECRFAGLSLPPDTKIYAAGAYAGRDLVYQIDQSGHQATRIDVAVNLPATPVVLLLGAYEPTVWNIGWAQRTRIVAVLASGYHRQAFAGLPEGIPTLISSHDNKGPCGYFYVSTDKLDEVNSVARRLFDRDVDRVYVAKDGRVTVGNDVGSGLAMVTAGRTPDSYRDPDAPLAGTADLDAAVRKGLLRPATQADAQAWASARAARPGQPKLPPVAGIGHPSPRPPELFRAYVVLGPMTFPAGLFGADAATFFVPKGVPTPSGNPGHSAIYDYNTLDCRGAICDRGQ